MAITLSDREYEQLEYLKRYSATPQWLFLEFSYNDWKDWNDVANSLGFGKEKYFTLDPKLIVLNAAALKIIEGVTTGTDNSIVIVEVGADNTAAASFIVSGSANQDAINTSIGTIAVDVVSSAYLNPTINFTGDPVKYRVYVDSETDLTTGTTGKFQVALLVINNPFQ